MNRAWVSTVTLAIAASMLASSALGQAQMRTGGIGGVSDRAAKPGSDKNFNPTDTRDPYNRGLNAFDAGDYKLAQRMFDEVLSDSPDDAVVLTLSGMSMSEQKDFRGARKQLEHAIRVDRKNLDAHRELGLVAVKLGDPKTAQTQLDWLKSQASCTGKCEEPGKILRAVTAVQEAMAAPKSG